VIDEAVERIRDKSILEYRCEAAEGRIVKVRQVSLWCRLLERAA
jgi:hypothetical protein